MPPQLLGPDGRAISSDQFKNKKSPTPPTGEAFGIWAGRDVQFFSLPGGGVVQFDLSKLNLSDYRTMRDHYQVNASLAVLSFMQHQSDWHIECEDQKIADECEEQLTEMWTPLNRGLSQANWAGFSPNVLQWENDIPGRRTVLDKVKDLYPEECEVNWKLVNGWAPAGHTPPKLKIFDGIKQIGMKWPIPVEASFWYPLLMENGDHYGRKLLRPAFPSWFFSILVHLFANRYYERFGEPVPVGRAPFDEEVNVDGAQVQGNIYMSQLLQQLRSRSVVVLPNDKSEVGTGQTTEYDYAIEYLESQMRGADFERYLTRLDEEISIGLFTPILLLRTADVGSYNLGVGHMQMYQWMLNAMNGDRKQYIDHYILSRIVNMNFSPKAPRARIKFRKLGNTNAEILKELLTALVKQDKAKLDLKQLGEMAGLTLTEIKQTLAKPGTDPGTDDGTEDPKVAPVPAGRSGSAALATADEIVKRVRPQIVNAMRDGTFNKDLKINLGFKKRLERALEADGVKNSVGASTRLYTRMDNWMKDVVGLGPDEFSDPNNFMELFKTVLYNEVRGI